MYAPSKKEVKVEDEEQCLQKSTELVDTCGRQESYLEERTKKDCGPNHPLVYSPLRCALIAFTFLLAFGWNVGFGLRAEIRVASWRSPGDTIAGYRREHYSMWHQVSCSDWNDNFEGSKQPVACAVSWFNRPGMVVALLGYLLAIAAGAAWVCQCRCCLCGSRESNASLQKSTACMVFSGGVMLLVGWIMVLTDTSLKQYIPANALPLPDGSVAGEHMHKTRWWFGMLSGLFFWMFGALIWFFRGGTDGIHGTDGDGDGGGGTVVPQQGGLEMVTSGIPYEPQPALDL